MSLWLIGRSIFRLNSSFLQSSLKRSMASQDSCRNRLGLEKSPYLLQHATNPVDWYPWGEEAFKAAKEGNKPIFLSVGYSTCHWCHVMERESFENPDIAKLMNENFINVKVDREERPDVDKVYMTFITASSGHGGWPLNVFLSPELVPIAGGTYFPPADRYGRPGFPTVLKAFAEQWKSQEKKFKLSGQKVMEILKKNSDLNSKSNSELPSEEVFAKAFSQFSRMYEPEYGGFGEAPKFPQPSNFNFLFAYKSLYPNLDDAQNGVEMCLHTLTMMERGGIHDHIAQGFARYSTDRKWHVPHFEKMLYDQAQLVLSYVDAFLLTGEASYSDVVRDIMTYVMRDLSHPFGGFYSAEDADSLPSESSEKKREGAFCVWTHEEICTLLSSPLIEGKETKLHDLFNFHYSVMEGGNLDPYQDPHDELTRQNVLLVHGTVAETAHEFSLDDEECRRRLKECCQVLFDARRRRPKPHLDSKMVTAWNGMMLSAAARAGSVLKDESYRKRAIENAEFIKKYLFKDGLLLRAAYTTSDHEVSLGSEIQGFADDYAWVIRGLTHLYDATLDDEWLRWAEELQEKQTELFWDSEGGGFYMAQKNDKTILLRLKDDHDGAEPSVNSVACGNLVRLSRLLNRPDYEEKAMSILKLYSDRLLKIPVSLPEMATALLLYSTPAEQVILAGDRKSVALKEMLDVVHTGKFNPNRVILVADVNEESSLLYSRHESLKKYLPREPGAIAYICNDFACSLPFKTSARLKEKMHNR